METKDFAQAVLKAVEIREESFDYKMADKMNKNDKFPDFKKCYQLSLQEAVDKTIKKLKLDPRMSQPVYLLLRYAWNDIQVWADYIKF